MFRLNRNERSHWSGNGVHVESELVFMIGRNMQQYPTFWRLQLGQGLAPTPVEPPLPETLVNSVLSISFNTPDCLIVTIGTVCENQDTSTSESRG